MKMKLLIFTHRIFTFLARGFHYEVNLWGVHVSFVKKKKLFKESLKPQIDPFLNKNSPSIVKCAIQYTFSLRF